MSINATPQILIVEDDLDLAEVLSLALQRDGYATRATHTGTDALAAIAQKSPDLVLLDVMIPQLSGTEVASRIRSNPATAALPIVMLTAKAEEVDQLVGLSAGADDYITKPFSNKVLLARIRALLRRTKPGDATSPPLRLASIELASDTHEVFAGGSPVKLTLTEFRILAALLGAPGKVLSRAELIRQAIGPGIMVTDRTIDVHVTAIRKKLGTAGRHIATVRGVGYKAVETPQDDDAGDSVH